MKSQKFVFTFLFLSFLTIGLGFLVGCGSDDGECKSGQELYEGVCVDKLWPLYKKLDAIFEDPHATIDIQDADFPKGTKEVEFSIDADTISFEASIYTQPIQPLSVTNIVSPKGNVYTNHPAIKYFSPTTMAVINGPFCYGCYLPEEGTWKTSIEYEEVLQNFDIHLKVAQKKAEQNPLRFGTIDLNFIFVGIPNVDSNILNTTDIEHQVLRRNINTMIKRIKNIFAEAGIKVGNIKFFDAPENQAEKFTVLDTRRSNALKISEYDNMMMEAVHWLPDDEETWRAVNVFFVQEITYGGDVGGAKSAILGLASGIPGMIYPKGLPVGGVAVAMGGFTYIEEQMGKVVAHEVGHLLGLFHPTEANGKMFDPLGDTPECNADTYDTNNDRYVDPEECADAGGDNLMFWYINLDNYLGNITEEQRYVMLHSLWVH